MFVNGLAVHLAVPTEGVTDSPPTVRLHRSPLLLCSKLPFRMRRPVLWLSLVLASVAAILFWRLDHRGRPPLPRASRQGQASEPGLILWAWETPEDLSTLDPHKAGVAFLSRELLLGSKIQLRPRRQPLRVPPSAFLIATVRLETNSSFRPSPAALTEIAGDIVAAARLPQVAALQIDFDALASERPFYVALLREVRVELPPAMPLSITALASWCSTPSWLRNLPIEEAVPMLFRMGGPVATRATAPRSTTRLTEPLCATSLGLATDETWPAIAAGQRVYLFRPGSWTRQEIANINAFGYQSLKP